MPCDFEMCGSWRLARCRLIGGQAVNYWAEHYLAVEPQLESLRPFTSEDIDFKGGTADVERIAKQLKLVPGYPPKVAMTALAGTIPFRIGELKSNIEIVRRIPGVSGSADALAVQAEWNSKTIDAFNFGFRFGLLKRSFSASHAEHALGKHWRKSIHGSNLSRWLAFYTNA